MRDPQRIDHLLSAVKRLWQQQPDLRLCQIITNAVGAATLKETPEYFYIEDEVLLKGLELCIEETLLIALQKKRLADGQSKNNNDSLQEMQGGAAPEGLSRGSGDLPEGGELRANDLSIPHSFPERDAD